MHSDFNQGKSIISCTVIRWWNFWKLLDCLKFTKRQDRHTFKKNGSCQVFHHTFDFDSKNLYWTNMTSTWHLILPKANGKVGKNEQVKYLHTSRHQPPKKTRLASPGCLGDRVLKRSLPGYTNQLQLHGFHAAPEVRKMLVGLGVRKIPRMMGLGTGKLQWIWPFFLYYRQYIQVVYK